MRKILRGFRIFRKKEQEKPVYLCDPEKAKKCNKYSCWVNRVGPCKCTKNKRWAKRDENGKRIIATEDDMYNLEWCDEQIKELLEASKPAFQKSQKKQGL